MSTCSEDDTASTLSRMSSDSICNELDSLLQRCEQLHEHIHNSTEALHAIHQMVSSGGNIKIKINGAIRDFDEVLEELHVVALERIHNGEQSNFGTTLLAILGGAQME